MNLQAIYTVLQNGVQALNGLTTQLKTSFPAITALSTVAPSVGVVTFTSSEASAFGLVQTSSGTTYRIALYPSS